MLQFSYNADEGLNSANNLERPLVEHKVSVLALAAISCSSSGQKELKMRCAKILEAMSGVWLSRAHSTAQPQYKPNDVQSMCFRPRS